MTTPGNRTQSPGAKPLSKEEELRASLDRVVEERGRLQEIVCRYDEAISGTQYVGSEGLSDVFKARESIWRDNQETMDAAQLAKRTGQGAALQSGEGERHEG